MDIAEEHEIRIRLAKYLQTHAYITTNMNTFNWLYVGNSIVMEYRHLKYKYYGADVYWGRFLELNVYVLRTHRMQLLFEYPKLVTQINTKMVFRSSRPSYPAMLWRFFWVIKLSFVSVILISSFPYIPYSYLNLI
jgi:hypothetical protein